LALYGWTRDPLIEYYVVESYGSYNPATCAGGVDYGSFESDGATYDVRRCLRVDAPSIEGTRTFHQYFSVRNPKKGFGNIAGTITVANHFAYWASRGLDLGGHDYMVMASEGYQSQGSTDITVSEGVAPIRRSGGHPLQPGTRPAPAPGAHVAMQTQAAPPVPAAAPAPEPIAPAADATAPAPATASPVAATSPLATLRARLRTWFAGAGGDARRPAGGPANPRGPRQCQRPHRHRSRSRQPPTRPHLHPPRPARSLPPRRSRPCGPGCGPGSPVPVPTHAGRQGTSRAGRLSRHMAPRQTWTGRGPWTRWRPGAGSPQGAWLSRCAAARARNMKFAAPPPITYSRCCQKYGQIFSSGRSGRISAVP